MNGRLEEDAAPWADRKQIQTNPAVPGLPGKIEGRGISRFLQEAYPGIRKQERNRQIGFLLLVGKLLHHIVQGLFSSLIDRVEFFTQTIYRRTGKFQPEADIVDTALFVNHHLQRRVKPRNGIAVRSLHHIFCINMF